MAMLASPTTPSNLSTQVPQGYVMRSIYNSIIINSTINSYKKIYKTEFMPFTQLPLLHPNDRS